MQEINTAGRPNVDNGYFIEELPGTDFASYAGVAYSSGVTAGSLINEGSGWLKFVMDNKELYVAKMNTRHDVSWSQLSASGVVDGSKAITVRERRYRVRLLKGSNTNPHPATPAFGFYLPTTRESEWDRLFYPIVRDDENIPSPPRNARARYTKADLEMGGDKRFSWCQEGHATNTSFRIVRGFSAPSRMFADQNTLTRATFAWRPCLELVP